MFDIGLCAAFSGIFVAALAGVLGVWMERDPERTKYFAIFFSLVILMAGVIEMGHAMAVAWNDAVTEDAMAEVLAELARVAESSDNPELVSFVGAELSRSDPKILKRVQKKTEARGGDPGAAKRRAAEGRAGKASNAAGTSDGTDGKAAKGPDGEGAEDHGGGKGADGPDSEGKAGKEVDGATAGKVGKEVDDATGGKLGKEVEGATEGKVGKAVDDAADSKLGKAVGLPGAGTETKAGKTGGVEGKAGKTKAP